MSDQFHAPATLSPRKERQVRIRQEAGWDPEPVWTQWRQKKTALYRESNPGRPAYRSVTILTEPQQFFIL
jgi:hypothetical protein